jgi:hypothetical protein
MLVQFGCKGLTSLGVLGSDAWVRVWGHVGDKTRNSASPLTPPPPHTHTLHLIVIHFVVNVVPTCAHRGVGCRCSPPEPRTAATSCHPGPSPAWTMQPWGTSPRSRSLSPNRHHADAELPQPGAPTQVRVGDRASHLRPVRNSQMPWDSSPSVPPSALERHPLRAALSNRSAWAGCVACRWNSHCSRCQRWPWPRHRAPALPLGQPKRHARG